MGTSRSGVMRSAASAAASTSMARRSSITSSTSPIELKPSGSMRKGTRLASAATKAPEPWRVVTRPSARKAATASRTTVRLTPMAFINSCSVGRRAPGSSRPLRISSAMRATTSSVRLRAGRSGRNRASLSAPWEAARLDGRRVIVQVLEPMGLLFNRLAQRRRRSLEVKSAAKTRCNPGGGSPWTGDQS